MCQGGELLFCLSVDLAVHNIGMGLARGFINGSELAARTTPRRPKVHQNDLVIFDGLLEIIGGQFKRAHVSSPTLMFFICSEIRYGVLTRTAPLKFHALGNDRSERPERLGAMRDRILLICAQLGGRPGFTAG